jgi:hypothetical protein
MVEVRKHLGEVVYQTKVEGGAVSKIFYYDFRMSGSNQVIVVTEKGSVQGFTIQVDSKGKDNIVGATPLDTSEK